MKLYAIKDVGSGFSQILMTTNNYNATRIMTDTINSPQPSLMKQYPKDFSLWLIGELNQDTGIVSPTTPELICEAVNLVKTPDEVKEK